MRCQNMRQSALFGRCQAYHRQDSVPKTKSIPGADFFVDRSSELIPKCMIYKRDPRASSSEKIRY